MAGMQCAKRLFFQVHRPYLSSFSDESTANMVRGTAVGLEAQKAFPGGRSAEGVDAGLEHAIHRTKLLIADPAVPAIFEATFEYDGVVVRADILERRGSSSFNLIEVKDAVEMKPHYPNDVAIQRYVLRGTGIHLTSVKLMHLNRDYIFDGHAHDPATLFTIVDLDPKDLPADSEIAATLAAHSLILGQPEPPKVEPGRQCELPHLCEFFDQCNIESPSDHVDRLPLISPKKSQELAGLGIQSIKHIPDDFQLSVRQRRISESVKTGLPFIAPELADEISELNYPLCFMDFETFYPALPWFRGMGPYDHIPFQWSVHRQESPGSPLKHFEYLASDQSDPRIPFTESLCAALQGANRVVVYNQSFEHSRLDDLARWLPQYSEGISDLKSKMWDLLRVVRQHTYFPAFNFSYSLKSVLPAVVPGMSYDSLEVADGEEAGAAWNRYVDPITAGSERLHIRASLLKYCEQDTLGLADLLSALRKHVPQRWGSLSGSASFEQ